MSQSGSRAQFAQLPMFMTARELRHETTPGDFVARKFGVPQSVEDMWDRKTRESESPRNDYWNDSNESLAALIRREGVKEPVWLTHERGMPRPTLSDGHHRVAAAHRINPNSLLPVEHSEGVNRVFAP